jgi:glyoxylase-like metal-dependent hydrolase (beta-lactamase superfamily II)
MAIRIDHTITSGTFTLDGGSWDVNNNVWVVGDDTECIVIDAPHSVPEILKVVDGRKVTAIVLTHAHDDHVRVAPELSAATGAPLYLHPADEPLWELVHPGVPMPRPLADGRQIGVLTVLHTPGHSPGAVCLYAPDLGCVFTGDTLFYGGPGATGRSFSDYDTIVASIRAKLFTLPTATVVHTGHGKDTLIASEKI